MAKKSQAGIYFSYDFINIVEQQNTGVTNFAKAPCVLDYTKSGATNQTVADEIKIVGILKDELLKNNIATRDVVLALLSRDLIIRFFEIPLVPHREIEATIGFEVKKYIPFRLEELVFDFQHNIDKKAKKIAVLFIAVRREIIDKYISLLEQAGLNIAAIEPVFFSTLRALKLTNEVEAKIPVAIIDVDPCSERGDITVIENFYPRFSRDLNLKAQPERGDVSYETILPKLINEIRISLDYCRRQFSSNPININKLIFLTTDDASGWIESLHKELEIPVIPVNVRKKLNSIENKDFDLELTKAYGASLRDRAAFPLKIDLFVRATALGTKEEIEGLSVLKRINHQIDKNFLVSNILALLGIVFVVYLLGLGQIKIYEDKLKEIKDKRESLSMLKEGESLSYAELKQMELTYNKKISILDNLKKERVYFTPRFSAIPALRQKGLWLTSLSFEDKGDKQNLTFNGLVHLGNEQEEFATVNNFLSELKGSRALSDFKDISLVSLSREESGDYYITNFEVSCK